ncbi:hypothetical protein [Patiriisocius sp. Uisw_017]|jgi:hypothetical protein
MGYKNSQTLKVSEVVRLRSYALFTAENADLSTKAVRLAQKQPIIPKI